MSDKKHIDRLFQEKLKDFEATPSEAVWDNIHERLHADKRKRRIIPFWWKLGGVAAFLAILLTVGIKVMSNDFDSNPNNSIVDTEHQTSDKETNSQQNTNNSEIQNSQSENSSVIVSEDINSEENSNDNSNNESDYNSENDSNNSNHLKTSNKKETRVVTNSNQESNHKNTSVKSKRLNASTGKDKRISSEDAIVNVEKNNKNTTIQNSDNPNKDLNEIDKIIKDSKNDNNSSITNASDKMKTILEEDKINESIKDQSIEEAIAEATTEEEKDEKEKKLNRWNVSPNVAPVYFNSLGKGSTLDAQFTDNAKQGEVTMSYGVGGSYAINNRIKVRAGINKVNMGYNTDNVMAYRSINPSSTAKSNMSNVNVSNTAENMTYLSTESLKYDNSPEILNSKATGSINQRFGFIEVPMELEYALINKKLGLNVIGGFSTLIVDKNDIYSVIDGTEMRIGEANNINNMSYSANFGLGVNYNISEKIKVNVEPTFKYQINTFSNSSGDFQPFFIGVYTGLSYKF